MLLRYKMIEAVIMANMRLNISSVRLSQSTTFKPFILG
jgi:hypothetical protein